MFGVRREHQSGGADSEKEMKKDEKATAIPDFIFCGNCLCPRDVVLTEDGQDGIVEVCDECGDDEYLLFGIRKAGDSEDN